ncbi:MAG: hypothetical protein AAFX85_04940, partial [Pseudomonadota bacterium]
MRTSTYAKVVLTLALALLVGSAHASDVLFATVFRASTNNFVEIDPATGAATVLGTVTARHGLSDHGGQVYAMGGSDQIDELDPASGSTLSSFVPGFGSGSEGAVAIRSDGTGFAIRGATGDPVELWSFSLSGGSSSLVIGDIGTRFDGLAFDASDVLFGLSQTGDIYTIDDATGAITLIGSIGISGASTSGIAFASDGTLYAVIDTDLHEIDTATGAATLVGPTGLTSQLSGLAALPEAALLFSLDIGSDMEISDPYTVGAPETLDPGDLYAASTIAGSTATPYLDDLVMLGTDVPPVQGALGSAAPVGMRSRFKKFFDLDGHDALDLSLASLGIDQERLEQPLLRLEVMPELLTCVYGVENVLLSFHDDDDTRGWQAPTPPRIPTDSGPDYGTALALDEVVALTVSLGGWLSHLGEADVHVDLAPGPDFSRRDDDDIDALDYLADEACATHYLGADDEGVWHLSPSAVYEVVAGSAPVERINHIMLGLVDERVDVDAFEFGWVQLPPWYGPMA